MHIVVGFASLIAVGLIAAVMLGGAAVGSQALAWLKSADGNPLGLHYPSLLLGLALGIVLTGLAGISWGELPRRMIHWVLVNERNFYRIGFAALCLGVLLFY